MMPGMAGDLGKGDSPLEELSALVDLRDAATDVVDAEVAEAVARSIDAGITWGVLADVLGGDPGEPPQKTSGPAPLSPR